MIKNNLLKFIKKYLENRPAFMAFIRPQEACLFTQEKKLITGKILDFGCGDGFFAEIVFEKEKINVGLDLKNSRAITAEKNKVYKKVVYYNGQKIPFSSNYFSTVISNCVLEHLPKLSENLKEINRVLKPHGYFVTTVMTDKWNDYLFGKNILGRPYVKYMNNHQQHLNLLTLKQWQKIFEKNNFKIIKQVGYLSKKNSQLLDIFHYLSILSLVTYKLLGCWVILPQWYKIISVDRFIKNVITYPKIDQSAAVFFVLQRK